MSVRWRYGALWHLALILAAGGLSNAGAQAAGLTLDQAIRAAVRDNKDLQAAKQVVEIAQARLLQAGLPPNPSLELGMRKDLLFGNHGEYTASVALARRFPVTGRIAEAIAAGTQADARIEALKFNIDSEVASAYTEAERLQAAVRQYQDGTLALSDRNVRLAQQGYDTGLAPIVTVGQAPRISCSIIFSSPLMACGDNTRGIVPTLAADRGHWVPRGVASSRA